MIVDVRILIRNGLNMKIVLFVVDLYVIVFDMVLVWWDFGICLLMIVMSCECESGVICGVVVLMLMVVRRMKLLGVVL